MKRRLSTTTTLTVVFGLLIGASVLAFYLITLDMLRSALREREIDKIKTVGSLIENMIREEERHVAGVAHLLASVESVSRSFVAGDGATKGMQTIDQSFARARVDAIELIDPTETIIYRAADPNRRGDQAVGWGVTEALAGQAGLVTDTLEGNAVIRALEPLRHGGQIVGALSVKSKLDAKWLRTLGRAVDARLALLPRRQSPVLSDPALAQHINPQAVAEAFQQKIPIYRADGHDRHTRVYWPILIVDEGFVVLADIDASTSWELFERKSLQAAYAACGILLLGIAASSLTSRRLLRPLADLRARAQQTAMTLGGPTTHADSKDEVGSAVQVLDQLTELLLQRNRELNDAKSKAETASEVKSRFLSTMSHEIRTPLTGMLGMSELLQNTVLNSEQARYVGAITSAGHQLHDLLSDILDMSKLEEHRVQIERIAFEPSRLLTALANAHRDLAMNKGLVFITDIDLQGAASLTGDPTRLARVLNNLLGNALKFTSQGSVCPRCRRLPDPDGDARVWLRFCVTDTGTGIEADALPRLFQRFEQADSATTRRFGGSGLGLAISRHLVELMGGRIGVESQPGAGSTFWLELPFDAAESPLPAGQAPAGPTEPLRILVAEDNPINQEIVRKLLESLGCSVTTVDNGEEAVAAVRREHFDMVLMDCNMPVLDGYEATARIRALQAGGPRVPVIAFTANAFVEDKAKCVAAGMDDFLLKPITGVKLAQIVQRHAPSGAMSGAAPVPAGINKPVTVGPALTADPEPPVLDPQVLARLPMVLNGTQPNFPERMLQMHAVQTAAALDEFDALLATGDVAGLRAKLHNLKSTSGQVGALALAAVAAGFEIHLREGRLPSPAWSAQLRDAFESLQRARRAGPAL